MLKPLLNVPKESRVLAVVSLTVLLQVLVLSAFGLTALRGQVAESERETRDLCSRVLDNSLVDEVVRRVRREEDLARTALTAFPVDRPGENVRLRQTVSDLLGPEGLFSGAFLVDRDGSWFAGDQVLLHPASAVPAPRIAPVDDFEAIEVAAAADDEPIRALKLVRERLDRASDAERPEGLRILAPLARRAGKPREAIQAWERIAEEYPTALDAEGVPLGPGAAWWRADTRLSALAAGEATANEVVEDVLALARMITRNRFQLDGARLAFEEARLDSLAERAARTVSLAEKVRLVDGLADLREEEKTFEAIRANFGALVRRAARGEHPGGHMVKVLQDGPRVVHVVPLVGSRGVAGAAALVLDLAGVRTRLLPEVLGALPLPDGVAAAVFDQNGHRVVPGVAVAGGRMLEEARFGDVLPFWSPRIYLVDDDLLERRMGNARLLHYGTMALSIAGLLAAGWFLLRTVRREIRLARLKSDFLGNVTHELKTPLTSIRMFVEMLQEGRVRDEAEREEYLGVIAREAERLTGLIQRVLDLAKFEGSTKDTLKIRPTPLGDVVREAAAVFRRGLTDAEVELVEDVPPDLPVVALDPSAAEEAILNLLSNAAKYGGRKIRLDAEVTDGMARVCVTDDGIGIPEEEQDRIFDKFYRVEDTLAREVEGSGLGLALVREIVKAHGGRVKVKSGKGRGSRFTITLPLTGSPERGGDPNGHDPGH